MQSNNHSDSKPTPPAPAGAEELAAAQEIVIGFTPFSPLATSTDHLALNQIATSIARHFRPLREENATLRNAQKACEDCMTPTYAALREEVEKLKADVSREVTLCDQMTMQRVPIDDDGVREFVLMALSRHTLLNRGELQYCADQILTAFAPTWEKLTAAEARCRELEVDKARLDWLIERGPPGASEDGMGLTDEVWEVAIAHAGPDMKTDNQAVRAAIDAARQRKD